MQLFDKITIILFKVLITLALPLIALIDWAISGYSWRYIIRQNWKNYIETMRD